MNTMDEMGKTDVIGGMHGTPNAWNRTLPSSLNYDVKLTVT